MTRHVVFVACPRYTLPESDFFERHGYSMLKLQVRVVLVCIVFVSPCVSQAAKTHPSADDSLQDRICLSEILIRTPSSDTPAQVTEVTEALHRAEGLRKAIQKGSSFADLAKANSGGPTAAQGGSIGCFKRGKLAKQLEELLFRLQPGEMSGVLRTKQGWVILQVTERSPR
jgi:parvulin-like peptidyl-prolyl isomerase